jgi:glycosyltransferase involved in cell wall biosynthesis
MKTLYYAGFQRDAKGFGWATCNANLRTALMQYFDVGCAGEVVFMPLIDHDFNPASQTRGIINIAYSFFEFPLGENAAENAKRYDTVFVGSTWCLDRCRERGITNAKVLIQGVDHSIFKPRDRPLMRDCFRIFSGGKFEWRKGQDLVIRAFAEFAKTHLDAHLVCSWFNPWPELVVNGVKQAQQDGMRVPLFLKEKVSVEEYLTEIVVANGIPRDRFTILPQLDQSALASAMRNTDVGLFPNRCEGGTNLVLMEYAACGKPVVANRLTGHADIAGAIPFPIPAREDEAKWAAQYVPDVVRALEEAYKWHRTHKPEWQAPTWAAAAATVADEVERIAASR